MSSLLLLAALVSKVQDATLPVFVESLPTQEEGEPMTQSETRELKPCPWCPTMRRETHETEAGPVGIIFHGEGCLFDGRQVLNPNGVKIWNTRAPVDSQGAEGIADDLPYRIVEEMGLGLTFRSCACGQLPCARLRPLRDALEAVRQNAATQMRTAYVALVREHERRHYGEMRSQVHKELIALLQAATLDQVKQK